MSRDTRALEEMMKWLPKRCTAFLDIGCGGGGVAAQIGRHFPQAEIHLIDGDSRIQAIGKNQNGFKDDQEPWNDRHVAQERVWKELGAHRCVRTYGPDPSLTIPVDLIVSTKSWGHHYPISTYIELAKRSLRPGGIIITDIRKDTEKFGQREGWKVMHDHGFRNCRAIAENQKCWRMVFER